MGTRALAFRQVFEIHGKGQLLGQGRPPPLITGQNVAHNCPESHEQQPQDIGKDSFGNKGTIGSAAELERRRLLLDLSALPRKHVST